MRRTPFTQYINTNALCVPNSLLTRGIRHCTNGTLRGDVSLHSSVAATAAHGMLRRMYGGGVLSSAVHCARCCTAHYDTLRWYASSCGSHNTSLLATAESLDEVVTKLSDAFKAAGLAKGLPVTAGKGLPDWKLWELREYLTLSRLSGAQAAELLHPTSASDDPQQHWKSLAKKAICFMGVNRCTQRLRQLKERNVEERYLLKGAAAHEGRALDRRLIDKLYAANKKLCDDFTNEFYFNLRHEFSVKCLVEKHEFERFTEEFCVGLFQRKTVIVDAATRSSLHKEFEYVGYRHRHLSYIFKHCAPMCVIVGPPGSGKTTMMVHATAQNKIDELCFYVTADTLARHRPPPEHNPSFAGRILHAMKAAVLDKGAAEGASQAKLDTKWRDFLERLHDLEEKIVLTICVDDAGAHPNVVRQMSYLRLNDMADAFATEHRKCTAKPRFFDSKFKSYPFHLECYFIVSGDGVTTHGIPLAGGSLPRNWNCFTLESDPSFEKIKQD